MARGTMRCEESVAMAEGARLGVEAFRALAAVAWADGKIDPTEAEAITRAAHDAGLGAADLEAVKQATGKRVALKEVHLDKMPDADKLEVYAISSWVAAINAGVGLRERIALNDLGKLLALTPKQREAMDVAVKELLAKPEGQKPGGFDLAGLRRTLADRVAAAAAPAAK
jgi:uncharacterized membrane protein YebE (DUF533 family)